MSAKSNFLGNMVDPESNTVRWTSNISLTQISVIKIYEHLPSVLTDDHLEMLQFSKYRLL